MPLFKIHLCNKQPEDTNLNHLANIINKINQLLLFY